MKMWHQLAEQPCRRHLSRDQPTIARPLQPLVMRMLRLGAAAAPVARGAQIPLRPALREANPLDWICPAILTVASDAWVKRLCASQPHLSSDCCQQRPDHLRGSGEDGAARASRAGQTAEGIGARPYEQAAGAGEGVAVNIT